MMRISHDEIAELDKVKSYEVNLHPSLLPVN
jgi:folate-dependent phosphoribosylglycinamide formyltransferase PurN